jgi:hydroxymethylglutaryl-CoA reductase (NADPH)
MSLELTALPKELLRHLYTIGSLKKTHSGFRFSIKNRLVDIRLEAIQGIHLNGARIPKERVRLHLADGRVLELSEISPDNPLQFALAQSIHIEVDGVLLPIGKHQLQIDFAAETIGEQALDIEDSLDDDTAPPASIPRDYQNDYSPEAINARQRFVEQFAGKSLEHIPHYSFAAETSRGNIENFTGVIQVPLGFAGPLQVNGEAAQGEFLIPLATTEGTLVASYNRGIKLLNLAGGVKATVVEDVMQRAPVFVFEDARASRDFVVWVKAHQKEIAAEAEATSHIAMLRYIDPYLASKYVYLRFNYATGDAAGQNMVGRATFAACNWILANYADHPIQHFYLESNFATDKKSSQVNILHTRGKRVIAEATIPRYLLKEVMRVEPEMLHYHLNVATTGAFLSGANNNGAHSPNAITAMFIATGQDVANVAESSAGILVSELIPNGDFYVSMTIPSLIVATYGGGTGLATQRECLELMGCYGKGKVNKLAEIIAGVVLAGELSLGSAISSSDWVESHELMGRKR